MKYYKIIPIVASILLMSCKSDPSEESISLNGNWKFYAIYGEGSNYMNIQVSDKDLVIDNKDERVVQQGTWSTKKSGARESKFFGEDYLQHYFSLTELSGGNKSDSSYVRYYPDFQKSGYYEAFTIYPFSSHLTAQYNIKHVGGISTKYVSQRVFCGEWNSLGIYEFNSKEKNYVELTAIVSGAVSADAIMFREISKEKYLSAKDQPKQVYKKDYDDSEWHDLAVPGHWGMINDFSNYTGIGWYRKTIELPQGWKKGSTSRYYLKFGGVYHLSSVYVNGKFVGKNRGGFTPFEFDVTDVLNYKGDNVIAVQADNSAVVGATWNWGGIIRDVTLSKNNDIRIHHQYVHANPDLKSGSAKIQLKVKVENNSNSKRNLVVSSRILDEDEIASVNKTVEVQANSVQTINLETILQADNVDLWHFDNPKLYQMTTTVSENELVLSQKSNHFGIRKVELTDSKMLLNGEPVRLAGFNRVSESRYWGSSEPLHVLEEDVDLMKEAGANFMRIMHGTQNEKLMELCDKKGIMIFEEINVRDLDNDEFRANYYPVAKLEKEKGIQLNPEEEEILVMDEAYVKLRPEHGIEMNEKNYFLAKYWLKGMIERDINHPSIIGWSVGNELNNHFEYGKVAMDYVKKELDPYRLLTCVSNSGQKEDYTPETDPNTFVDLIMHNMYGWQGKPQEILNTLREKWPNKPVFISEFGFDPFPSTALDSDKEVFSEWTNYYRHKNEFVIGTSMWTFNDYRSAYAGTTAEENRVWGVITTWREKRRLFDRIKKEHAPVLDIEVSDINFEKNSAKVKMPIRGESDYPSHAMYNYKLAYKFRDSKGKVFSENSVDLPDLKPADKIWEGSIQWEALPEDVLDLTLSLFTPTGYSRLNKTISFKPAITPEISKVIPGKKALRVLFEKVPNATEYFVEYSSGGQIKRSYTTIDDYIDLQDLQDGASYNLKLFALNDKGSSKASATITTSTTDQVLPPIVWDAFISNNKLVIGYSSDFNDGNYTVQYGESVDHLDKTFSSNVLGMMSIDLENESNQFFRIKRVNQDRESSWSQIVEAEKTQK